MEKEADGGEVEASESVVEVRPVRLSLHLIAKRHLPKEADTWNHEQVIEALAKITHLRLDRENIGEIDSLELLGGGRVSNVYLQQNLISVIENLDCLLGLQFLTLAGNRISRVQNLTHLKSLLFLDLSDNHIQDFDIDEFPQSLIILDLQGNPCCDKPDYRGRVVQDLARLKQLDGQDISKVEKMEVGFHISSDEDDDGDQVSFDDDDDDGVGVRDGKMTEARAAAMPTVLGANKPKLPDIEVKLRDLANEMLVRSQDRLESTLQQHHQHVVEIHNMRMRNRQLKAMGRPSPPTPDNKE